MGPLRAVGGLSRALGCPETVAIKKELLEQAAECDPTAAEREVDANSSLHLHKWI